MVLSFAGCLLVLAVGVVGHRLWNGAPYPVVEHPGTGYTVDVDWYRSTGTFAVSTYAPCGRLPDGFDAYDWPQADRAAPE